MTAGGVESVCVGVHAIRFPHKSCNKVCIKRYSSGGNADRGLTCHSFCIVYRRSDIFGLVSLYRSSLFSFYFLHTRMHLRIYITKQQEAVTNGKDDTILTMFSIVYSA